MPVLPSSTETVLPSTSAKALIARAYRLIGVLAAGEELKDDLLNDGLAAFNGMLSSWNLEGLMLYTQERQTFTLTASDGSYTIGPSGDFETERPTRIEAAGIIPAGETTEHPIAVLTRDKYAAIRDKSTVGTPYAAYFDGEVPNRNVTIIQPPTSADTLVIYANKALRQVALSAVLEELDLPDGYEDAIPFNLALRLAGENERDPSLYVIQTASETKANIKRANMEPLTQKCDSAFLTGGGGRYDINTDEYL